jgi:hypothetical protein
LLLCGVAALLCGVAYQEKMTGQTTLGWSHAPALLQAFERAPFDADCAVG